MKSWLVWPAAVIAALLPLVAAAQSPLLAWRDPIYIAAGFFGILALSLMVFQPLLAAGWLPGLTTRAARQIHRGIGAAIILCVLLHVVGLWVTSPPDVVDALLLRSPTPFALWGVIALWALIATAGLVILRDRAVLPWRRWRQAHSALAVVIIAATVLHAVLIQGTMEPYSKAALSVLLAAMAVLAFWRLGIWGRRRPGNRRPRA